RVVGVLRAERRLRIRDIDVARRVEAAVGDLHGDDLASGGVVDRERIRPGQPSVVRLRDPYARTSDDVELERLAAGERRAAAEVASRRWGCSRSEFRVDGAVRLVHP